MRKLVGAHVDENSKHITGPGGPPIGWAGAGRR